MFSLLKNKIIQGALAGIADAQFCLSALNQLTQSYSIPVGAITLGGLSIGEEMLVASTKVRNRNRNEFLWEPTRISKEIQYLFQKAPHDCIIFLNLRVIDPQILNDFLVSLIRSLDKKTNYKKRLIIEINAHCQQAEFVQKGAGMGLLYQIDLLKTILSIISSQNLISSLKTRICSQTEYEKVSRITDARALDILHLDCYQKGRAGHDFKATSNISRTFDGFLIANNSLYTEKSIKKALKIADSVSIARPLLKL